MIIRENSITGEVKNVYFIEKNKRLRDDGDAYGANILTVKSLIDKHIPGPVIWGAVAALHYVNGGGEGCGRIIAGVQQFVEGLGEITGGNVIDIPEGHQQLAGSGFLECPERQEER